jgi:SNF2 family DNA or RNA helicase
MEFVDKTVLGPFTTFERTFIKRDGFGRPTRYRNMSTLQRAMAPVMMRRSRADIAEWLPVIIPKQQWVNLEPRVQALYDFIAADTLRVLDIAIANGGMGGFNLMAHYGKGEDYGGSARGQIMSRLTCMRMLCDHPDLLIASANEFDDPDSKRGSEYAWWLKENGYLDNLGSGDSKLRTCADALAQILLEDPANKVVVFSYFKPMLRMLAQQIKTRLRKPYAVITGDHSAAQRREALKRFAGPVPILLSSDAGQYGVDLPHCNHLISYDLPWSAGAYAQRVARIDRISSVWPHVTVMTLLTQGTIEHRQFDMLREKRLIAEAWLDGAHIDAKDGLTLSLESLRDFLRVA